MSKAPAAPDNADIEFIFATPEIVTKWLEKNNHNRKIKPRNVATFVGIIKRKEWRPGDSAICFAPDGTMLNGQHRCLAIKESGQGQWVMVRRNVDPSEQLVMDQGVKRQAYEQMDIMGIAGGKSKQALCRAILLYDDTTGPTGRLEGITNKEIIELAEGDEDMDTALNLAKALGRAIPKAGVTAVALGYYLLLHAWPEKVEEFHYGLSTGVELSEGSPLLKLRNVLMRNDVPQLGDVNRKKLLALFLKAFNLWVDGQERETLVWRSYEEWPVPYTKDSYAKLLQARARSLKGAQTRLKKVAG